MKTMLTKRCFLALIFFTGLATVSAAEPAPAPKSFRAAIGGFFGPSYRVEFKDGVLSYTAAGRGQQNPKAETVKPTEAQWREFRKALDDLKVWQWKDSYFNHGVADGTQWTLEVAYEGTEIKATGSNSYPGPDGKANGSPEQTKTFTAYLKAVEKLLGGKAFQ